MKKVLFLILIGFFAFSCKEKFEKTKPVLGSITESIYASGYIKSDNQYAIYPKVSGIVEHVYVESGDLVIEGSPIISIYDENQQLNSENAALTAKFYDFNSNVEKLNELFNQIDIARSKMTNDSIQFDRQKQLKNKGVGVQMEYDNSELSFISSKRNYENSILNYKEFKRQLEYNSAQAKKNQQILGNTQKDYSVFSELNGKVYSINVNKGELVNQQTLIAVLGDAENFILEMQIDENDILKIEKGMEVIIGLDSYPDQSFKAIITKINPLMNDKTKTFVLEAEFVEQPEVLYPNMNFEANILTDKKEKTLIIPREYVVQDNLVINAKGDTITIETGLMDYKMIEVLSGITSEDELRKPE